VSTEDLTSVDGDWEAVGRAIRHNLGARRMQWQDLVDRSGISDSTVREIGHNRVQRRRHPSTLVAIAEALGLPPGYLGQVLSGEIADPPAGDEILSTLREVQAELKSLRDRVDALESSRSR
jgi:transcriptional regulator with XRE-family HTH domain